MPGSSFNTPKARHRIARIVGPAQHRHHVLDVRRLQELEAAVFHERNVALGQFDFEHVAVMRAAEQDGVAFQRTADFTRRQDLARDVLRLRLRVIDGDVERLLRRIGALPSKVLRCWRAPSAISALAESRICCVDR